MAIFRCKMCGGDLEIIENASSCTCEFCGTQQTIPTVKDEKLQVLFNRANVLRMKSEFDKAEEIYEKILQSSSTEAEAYWGMILCKYGIEYVEDPTTFKRVPTCHRASYEAITADVDYKNALQYADVQQKRIYEEEAKEIEEVQKGIMALVANEQPYDVFICYKETDDNGKRTQDSVIANDIYYQLTQEGFKVFYAAITLEDKLGTEYEPYIFSALNTAKVMISLGTKPEYFNAVWVKNEWSRFLKVMKKDRSKILIPCYRDMDAYELPEEFAHLQAQDMSKIGFINDIVRGIKKVVVKEETTTPKDAVIVQQATPVNSNVQALLDRGNMALEDSEWQKADGFFEEVLNQDAKCAEAYLGKLMAKHRESNIAALTQFYISKYKEAKIERLEACPEDTSRIEKAVSSYVVLDYLSDAEIKKQYEYDRTYSSELSSRKQQKSQQLGELDSEKLLVRAQQYAVGETKELIEKMLTDITNALDRRIAGAQEADKEQAASVKSAYVMHLNKADAKVKELHNKALERQESTYNARVEQMNQAQTISEYESVRDFFRKMHGYKDTEALADKCQAEIERIEEEERLVAERVARKKRITAYIISAIIAIAIIVYIAVIEVIIPQNGLQTEIETISKATIGDTVEFGNYNGNTEWIVLEREDEKILVISKYAIEKRLYNTEYVSITWEKCTLRSWLNGTYLSSAFSSGEQARIVETSISNPDNSRYGTYGGNKTNDKVFLLSIDEVNKYFTSNSAREAVLSDGTSVWWWLRSPGLDSSRAAVVLLDGSVHDYGYDVDAARGAVRPALWIDISNL